MLRFEAAALRQGFQHVAGVDEAGRGPLAGPVVAAAVILDRKVSQAAWRKRLAGLTDSKKLSASQREAFFLRLTGMDGVAWAIGQCPAEEIDRLNILRATHQAMRRALEALPCHPDYALVDGLPVPGLPCPHRAVVKGDSLSLSIAAASVLAKVTRDRVMDEAAATYPAYGFDRHKGYGTREHLAALRARGPCPIHRRSFAPVSQLELPL